jgi:8-hydroxy-5-deazaflavin:NADPH oxidoreductase
MKIAIIGTGNVGGALGRNFVKAGHEVSFGVRNPGDGKHQALAKETKANVTGIAQAVSGAEIVVLATPWGAAREAIEAAGPLSGKILVDTTNALKSDFSGLQFESSTSAAEKIAEWAKGARVVKSFNHTAAENMARPGFPGGGKAVNFAAGDDAEAVKKVVKLAADIGFDAVGLPTLQLARQLEQLAWLYIFSAFNTELGRNFAFSLVRR